MKTLIFISLFIPLNITLADEEFIPASSIIGNFYYLDGGSSSATYLVPLGFKSINHQKIRIDFTETDLLLDNTGDIDLTNNTYSIPIQHLIINCKKKTYSINEGNTNYSYKEFMTGEAMNWGDYSNSNHSLSISASQEEKDKMTNMFQRTCDYMNQF